NDSADVGFISDYTTSPFTPGVVNLQNVTLVKQGGGQLILDNTAPATGNNNLTGSTLDIQAGRVVAIGASGGTNPLGTAGIKIDGGTLSLDSKAGSVTFDNPVTVAASGVIEAQPAALTMTLGSAGNGVTINSGQTLTVNTFGGTPTGQGNL